MLGLPRAVVSAWFFPWLWLSLVSVCGTARLLLCKLTFKMSPKCTQSLIQSFASSTCHFKETQSEWNRHMHRTIAKCIMLPHMSYVWCLLLLCPLTFHVLHAVIGGWGAKFYCFPVAPLPLLVSPGAPQRIRQQITHAQSSCIVHHV